MVSRRNHVLLRDTQDEAGSRQLSARLRGDGTLLIEGHDLGPGVAAFFGPGKIEYEWAISIAPPAVEKLMRALASKDHVLNALEDRFSGDASAELQAFLDNNGVHYEFWSRAGE